VPTLESGSRSGSIYTSDILVNASIIGLPDPISVSLVTTVVDEPDPFGISLELSFGR
jgi:hypothetical protein